MATTGSERLTEKIDRELKEEVAFLDNCQIGDEEMLYLSESLKDNNTVKRLFLYNNKIGNEGIGFLSKALQVNQTVKLLNLENNQIGNEGMRFMSEALQVNQTMKVLYLYNNRIGDEGMRFLSASFTGLSHHRCDEALRVNQTVKELSLGGNQIGNKGIGFLSDAIRVNTSIKNVFIGYDNNISYECARDFEALLADMPTRHEGKRELEARRMVKSALKR